MQYCISSPIIRSLGFIIIFSAGKILLSFSLCHYLFQLPKGYDDVWSESRREGKIILTIKFFISVHSCNILRVPTVFMFTALFRSASMLRTAAIWNTMCTSLINFCLSFSDKSKSVSEMSPAMATTFSSIFGLAFLKLSKICNTVNEENP